MAVTIVKPNPNDPATKDVWGALINAALDALVAGVNGEITRAQLAEGLLASATDPRFSDARAPINGTVTTASIAVGGLAQSAISGLVAALANKATPADVTAAVNALIGGAPGTLDTLKEIADQLANDESAATAIAGRLTAVEGALPSKADESSVAARLSDYVRRTGLAHGTLANRPDPSTLPEGSVYVSDDVSGGKAQQVRNGAWSSIAAPYYHGKDQHLPWESDPIRLNADLGLPIFTVPQANSADKIQTGQPYLYGDGVHDDAPAINWVIQQARAANGGIVQLPIGTFYCFTTVFLGFLPVAAAPADWTNPGFTAQNEGDTIPTSFVVSRDITLRGAGMYATKLVRVGDIVMVDISGVAGTDNNVTRFARRCNIEDLNLYGGLGQNGNGSVKPVLRHAYATVGAGRNVDILDAAGPGWKIIQSWDSMFSRMRVDNCGGNPSGTVGGTAFTPNATPLYPALHMVSGVPGITSGKYGYASDTTNNLKFRDLTLESYRDGAMWIDGSSGFWNGCNGITFSDLKVDTTQVNGPAIVITAGVGGANNQQRKNYNINIDGLVVSQGQTLYSGNSGPWDGLIVQDTAGLIITNAIITPQSASNGPPLKNGITFRGNNLGVLLDNVGLSGSTNVSGTPTYPLSLLNFESGQNDVTATGWGRWDKAGGQLPLMVGTPTTGTLSPPIYGQFSGNGANELTTTEYGGLTRWGPSGGQGVGLAVSGDTFARSRLKATGLEFGTGTAARDTTVARSAAGVVSVSNALTVVGLIGATAASRYVGATATGGPASGDFLKGDFAVAQDGKIWICTAAGSPGTWATAGGAAALAGLTDVALGTGGSAPADGQGLVYDGTASKWVNRTLSGTGNVSTDSSGHVPAAQMARMARGQSLVKRSAAVAETFSRLGTTMGSNTVAGSGVMHLTAIPLLKGDVVNTITFYAVGAAASPTNQWFALYDASGNKLAVTNDDTTNAWAASSEKTLTLASPYTVSADGMFYVALMVVATTVPTIASTNSIAFSATAAPLMAGRSAQTGLTTPSTAPATVTFQPNSNQAYAWAA